MTVKIYRSFQQIQLDVLIHGVEVYVLKSASVWHYVSVWH